MKKEMEKFIGFPIKPEKGDFWMYPRVMDNYWQYLNGSEQKVLDFILRHTWGFRKDTDQISLTQLERGAGKLDKGTGLTRTTIIKARDSLIAKGFITKTKDRKALRYELVVKEIDQISKESIPIASKDTLHTINTNTINNKTKDRYDLFFKNDGLKPFYGKDELRWKDGKWMVIPKEGGPWCEYVDKVEKIEWKKI